MPTAVGDLAEVVVEYQDTINLSRYVNVLGFKAIDTGGSMSELAADVHTALIKNTSGGLLFSMVNDVTCSQCTAHDVYPGTAAPFTETFATVAGNGTGDDLPPQCAAVLSWRTPLSGRSFRGRTYLPGGSEDNQGAGRWVAGHITNLETIIAQMLAVFGPTGTNTHWTFCIISRVSNGGTRNPPIGTQVTAGHVDPIVFGQRRRTVGVGS